MYKIFFCIILCYLTNTVNAGEYTSLIANTAAVVTQQSNNTLIMNSGQILVVPPNTIQNQSQSEKPQEVNYYTYPRFRLFRR